MMEVSQDLRHSQMQYLYLQTVATLGHVLGQPLSDLWQKNPAMKLCKTKAGLAQYSNSDGAVCRYKLYNEIHYIQLKLQKGIAVHVFVRSIISPLLHEQSSF